tara:strand:- start:374 stop:598 length:225 start_codon:yes stop_codon:yes gene_type:complete
MGTINDWALVELVHQIAECEGVVPVDTFMADELAKADTDVNYTSSDIGNLAFTLFGQAQDKSGDENLILANVFA